MDCECEVAGFCNRWNRQVNAQMIGWCQQGRQLPDTAPKRDALEIARKSTTRFNEESRLLQNRGIVTTVGSDILDAMEHRLGRRIGCNACRTRLHSLNHQHSPRFYDVVTMLNGDIGGAVELKPNSTLEIAAIVERFIPRQSDPFTAEPVLHFGAHLWPTPGTWQWHVDLWNRMPSLINGRRFVGIATDGSTDRFETVRRALHPAIECREFANDREGENHTFRWLQEVCPKEQNDILIYCHGKGAQSHTNQSGAVRQWSEAMYETVVFNHEMIREKITSGYNVVGSFREFGRTHLMPRHKWHFTGTFFAVRAKLIADKRVKAIYGGVEAWPGDHFRQFEAWSEFGDNVTHAKLYSPDWWQAELGPALIEWRRKRNYEQ